MKKINYIETSSFKNKFKSFKKYITLKEDFNNFKINALEAKFLRNIPIEKHILVTKIDNFEIYIAKRFDCRYLKRGANSGFRIVYVWNCKTQEIYFLEIYHKKDKDKENKTIIKDFIKIYIK